MPQEVAELSDACRIGGLLDAQALPEQLRRCPEVALERSPVGVVPPLGLGRQREQLRHSLPEQRLPEALAKRIVRDHDAAVLHHGRGHRGLRVLPSWRSRLQPA